MSILGKIPFVESEGRPWTFNYFETQAIASQGLTSQCGLGKQVSTLVAGGQITGKLPPPVKQQSSYSPGQMMPKGAYLAIAPQKFGHGSSLMSAFPNPFQTDNFERVIGHERKCHSKLMPAPKAGNWMKSYGNWNGFCQSVVQATGRDLGGGVLRF
jgi:hypothetical protein